MPNFHYLFAQFQFFFSFFLHLAFAKLKKIPHKPWVFAWLFLSALAGVFYWKRGFESQLFSQCLALNAKETVFLSLGAGLGITFPFIEEKMKGLWFIFALLIAALNLLMLLKALVCLTFFFFAPLLLGGVILVPALWLRYVVKEMFK